MNLEFLGLDGCRLKYRLDITIEHWDCCWWQPCPLPNFTSFPIPVYSLHFLCVFWVVGIYLMNWFCKVACKSGCHTWISQLITCCWWFCQSCLLVVAASKSWQSIAHYQEKYWEGERSIIIWKLGTAFMLRAVCSFSLSQEEPSEATGCKGKQLSWRLSLKWVVGVGSDWCLQSHQTSR